MRQKISITLSPEILARIDAAAGRDLSRSAFIELVLREYLLQDSCGHGNTRDLERINAAANRLNQEALDVLQYTA